MSSGDDQVATTDNAAAATDQPAAEGEQQQGSARESFMSVVKSMVMRGLVIYFVMSFFKKPQAPVGPSSQPSVVASPAVNIFENGTLMDLYMFLSENEHFSEFGDEKALVWSKQNLMYGDWTSGPEQDGSYSTSFSFPTSQKLRNNGSIFLHVYVTKAGRSPDPKSPKYVGKDVAYAQRMMNRFKKRHYVKTHNLLTGETAASEEHQKKAETTKKEVVSHWHPNITVNIITDFTNWVQGSVPPPLDEYVVFLPGGNFYKPVVYMNDYWNMQRDYQPINDTTLELKLQVTFQPLSLLRWQLYAAQSMRNKWTSGVFGDTFADDEDVDQDSLKEALLETSPYLLGLTFAISILHSIFEILAFKNDIQFWNNRKSLEGLSVRSVFFNVFQSTVVLLYVLDNDTNTVVRISCFVGLGIEIWKIHKVMDVKVGEQKILGFIPRIEFKDKGSYVNSSTRQYDMMAYKYLSWALFPLLGGYCVYSLLYEEHKGWYSWVLSMLYGFLLTFGFIMMTPQLFINYKLKSVAHLPWRMMSYKFLNTFIDDIFAFVIKMPTMYRLGCFRDDIVFFIFLYQRWIYKTDPSRLNEFGFSAEMEQEAKAKGPAEEVKPIEDKKKD
ncbi:putative lipid scramblase CLPTM1 [Neocloeon triangulifer]|uniref:putative lipid scramblase CLPTM1 n=1 Tax=Neocloeon triangulifer TaxID=2078957 RepID=UPI00286EEB63|nr:putative lipid scramblase CLPTM1 [Neocloeon triangulifer]